MSNRIYIIGWFGFENFGDDLLLNTIIKLLSDHSNYIITVPVKKEYKKITVNQVKRSYFNFFFSANCQDILIIGPGGLFPSNHFIKVFVYYLLIKFWKLKKRKVIFWGIGISQKMGIAAKQLWKIIVKESDLFVCRNKAFLKEIYPYDKHHVYSICDIAFLNEYLIKENVFIAEGKKVGIFVANISDDHTCYGAVLQKWILIVSALISMGYEVDLIAFTKGLDDKLIDDVANSIGGNAIGVYHYSELEVVIDSISQYYFTITQRFHSLVLSTLARTPTICLAYGQKMEGLCKEIGISDNMILWNEQDTQYFGKYIQLDMQVFFDKLDDIESKREMIIRKMENYCSKINTDYNRIVRELYSAIDE